MQPWKRIRLAPDSDAYINPAPDPAPTPAHVPDYAAELDALPPESPEREIEFDSDDSTEFSEPEPEVQQPLDLERLWQLHFELSGN